MRRQQHLQTPTFLKFVSTGICFLMLGFFCTTLSAQDQIKFEMNGNEAYVFDSSRVHLINAFDNVMIGLDAGKLMGVGATDSLHGTRSVGIGAHALQSNNWGFSNVAVGYQAMISNTTGFSNTSMGYLTLAANTIGSHNTAVGEGALGANISGHANTAFGDDAMLRKSIGNNNTAIGQGALEYLSNGHGNVALGYRAGSSEMGSNRLYIHNDTTGPGASLIYGEFDNGIVRVNGELQIGTAYKFPTTDGAFEQVMMTNGVGDVAWQTLADDDAFNELIDSVRFNYPYLEFYQGGVPIPLIQADLYALIDDADADPTNELQTLSVSNDTMYISGGNGVKIPGGTGSGIMDADGDTRVEAFDQLFGNDNIDFTLDNTTFLRMAEQRIGFINTDNNVIISDMGGGSPGLHNTFIGSNTGNATTVGVNNTFLGSGAGASIFTGSGNVFLGKDAGAGMNVDNTLVIDNSNTSTPLIHGNFAGPSLDINGHFHVKHTGTEAARFESIDNTIVSFHRNGTQKGLIQTLNEDFLFGKISGTGGSVQLYNQGNSLQIKDHGTYSYQSTSNDAMLVEFRRAGDQKGYLSFDDDALNGVNNNFTIGKGSVDGNIIFDNNGEYIFFEPDGDVGIGTNNGMTIPAIPNKLRVESGNTAPAFSTLVTYNGSSDVIAIEGESVPGVGFGIGGDFKGGWYGARTEADGQGYTGTSYGLRTTATGTAGTRIGLHASASGGATNWAGYFTDGNVYVKDTMRLGSTSGADGYRLSVDGKIMAEELKIQDSGSWPDYVFADDYQLMPLEEVEQAIRENKHLPGIPSAAEVESNGIMVGDMQKMMMEKIEELTLHVIALQKRIVELEGTK